MADNLSLEDLQKLKVADLKKELKQRGLSQAGNKTELIERLQLAYEQGSPSLDNEELLDDDEDDLADESLEEDLAAIKDEESENIVLGSKRKLPAPAPTASLPLKKVVLNRTAVAAVETENLEEEAPATTDTAAADDTVVKKGGAKITSLTSQERLEHRASKFGVPMSADAQKAARAARFGITASTTTTTGATPANVDALKKRAERFGGSVSSTLTKVEMDEKLKKRQERFGVVEPAANGKAKTKVVNTLTTTITSSSTSVKVPITLGNSAADDKKKSRAERFKATL